MKILVTGASGQLGYDVCRELSRKKMEYVGLSSKTMDITDISQIHRVFTENKPDAVIHCAAYTNVDQAENEPEKCWAVNAVGTQNIALACRSVGAKLLYISTDYVFPGTGDQFYEVCDGTSPKNIYGLSKLAGELAVKTLVENYFIVRASWAFGCNGENFVKAILRKAQTEKQIDVVNDQIGSPTYTVDLAGLLCDMVVTNKYGVYHATNEGVCSWAEFAMEILRQSGMDTKVHPVTTADYPSKAIRPKNSRMCKDRLRQTGFSGLPSWQDALRRYLQETGHTEQGNTETI